MPNWDAVLKEIAQTPNTSEVASLDIVRRKYIAELSAQTGRNTIAYYSGFLTKPDVAGIEINDDDKNGFMLCIHELNRRSGLDLILHTPGGNIAATESLVAYLREMFGNDIRAIIPQIAMSAGCMIACSCKNILMGKQSNLGPIDPQFGAIPAIGVLKELEMAFSQIQQDPRAAALWNPILSKLTPSFVQQCHWAVERAKEFVVSALTENMFAHLAEPARSEAVYKAVDRLSDLDSNKSHDRHFSYKELRKMGLDIALLEDVGSEKLQDLVLTVHHCYTHALSNTGCFKIIENQLGRAYIRQNATNMVMMPQMQLPFGMFGNI